MTPERIEAIAGAEAVAIMRRQKFTRREAIEWCLRFDGKAQSDLVDALNEKFVHELIRKFGGKDVSKDFGIGGKENG